MKASDFLFSKIYAWETDNEIKAEVCQVPTRMRRLGQLIIVTVYAKQSMVCILKSEKRDSLEVQK